MKNNHLREFKPDRIHYFFIGKRESIFPFEAPEILNSDFTKAIQFFPKSLAQFIDSVGWNLRNITKGEYLDVKLYFLFDDYPKHYYKINFSMPSSVSVIILNSVRSELIQEIESVKIPLLITSEKPEVIKILNLSNNLRGKIFNDGRELVRRLESFSLKTFNLTKNEYRSILVPTYFVSAFLGNGLLPFSDEAISRLRTQLS